MRFPPDVDASVVFSNAEGLVLRGRAFRRFYILTKDQMNEFMNELTSIAEVSSVVHQAENSGLQV